MLTSATTDRPNFLVIVTDDQGYRDGVCPLVQSSTVTLRVTNPGTEGRQFVRVRATAVSL